MADTLIARALILSFYSVCFASVYRIIVISRAAPEDFTYAQAQPGAWTVIEMHSAIISANLPCLAPLFKTWFRNSSLAAKSTGVPSSNMELRESGQPRSQQSAESSGGDQDGFERLDDSDTGSRADSTVNIRPENTGRIVVETEISAVRRQSLSNSEVDIMQKHKISGWLSR